MTDQEINVAVAECCGWTKVHMREHFVEGWPDVLSGHPPGKPDDIRAVPNYCTDLNAMHEAEKTLNTVQRIDYVDLLEGKHTPIKDQTWTAFHATARQRAEALLRTLGKWKE